MSHTVVLRNVPADKVDEVVAEYESEGATVSKTEQPDGNYTVTANFPDTANLAMVSRHGMVDYALASYRDSHKKHGK